MSFIPPSLDTVSVPSQPSTVHLLFFLPLLADTKADVEVVTTVREVEAEVMVMCDC